LRIEYLVGVQIEDTGNTQQQQRPLVGEHLFQQNRITCGTIHS
jgi:hypothetical protein